MRNTLLAFLAALLLAPSARAQEASPHAIDIPAWFTDSFLDFRDDVADAARDRKRLLVYFGQDGCPYCRELMVNNFSQRAIVDRTRAHFVAIALNIWGDRETTWMDGKVRPEKELARLLDVQFTPTLLFLDEEGRIVARLNGYYPPQRFSAVLDYVAGKRERTESLGDYLRSAVHERGRTRLRDEPFLMRAPFELRRKRGSKPLAVVFETSDCAACEEMHAEGFQRSTVRKELAHFDVARFALGTSTPLVTPDGRSTRADAWARELKVAYTPTIAFFDDSGREVFRIDAYLRPFHLASALDYVSSGAYLTEPSFQRFIQTRAARLRDQGEPVEPWE